MSLEKPTARQQAAFDKRATRLKRHNDNADEVNKQAGELVVHYLYACIGCFSGVRVWNQGSDYCNRCLGYGR